jgi:CheY-like chemotaxis protein/anti-sigma regulatory factor (Ser/Thr protein kinase)
MFRPLQTTETVNLVFEEPAVVPVMYTDEGKVSQIVRNLVSNALKFTEKGEVRVSARYLPQQDVVAIGVTDTGIGIPAEHLNRIFEEFSQVDNPVQRRVKGTGLGLPLVRRLTGLLGGGVTVESQLGVGSTFTAHIRRRLESEGDAFPGDRLGTALIIDDEEIARYLLRQRIRQTERVLEAGDGTEGIRLARAERPDVIFLDLNMPGGNGLEVLREIRREPSLRAVAVVVVTAQPLTAAEVTELNDLGAVVLPKSAVSQSGQLIVNLGPPVRVRFDGSEPG